MNDTVVLKFGGSSVADNIKLEAVTNKIIEWKEKTKNIVVVVSAQGKTTDRLIGEAQELSAIPEEREMDMLLSTGEQITAAKLSILLNRRGFKAISLTGWQSGIQTNKVHKNAKIETIYPKRILEELEKGKIVIITGFQGIDKKQDITTLGRGGSDTTAVAISAAINADQCVIFSDVDGIYSTDPNKITIAKKLDEISFEEMQAAADSGAKVLHNRCIQIGEKFNCNIIASSTFKNTSGTRICKKIENTEVKNIVKNEKLLMIKMKALKDYTNNSMEIYKSLLNKNIILENFRVDDSITFRILKSEQNKVVELLENKFKKYQIYQEEIIKLSIIGYCIAQDNKVLNKVFKILADKNIEIKDIYLTQSKIEIIVDQVSDEVVQEIHEKIIK